MIAAGASIPRAFYFGCLERSGHFFHDVRGFTIYEPTRTIAGFPWSTALMDTGLLVNGQHADVVDGRVWWTCARDKWLAFFWWDRSGDVRGNSNSGFYVHGFDPGDRAEAFSFACSKYPRIVSRQRFPLVLQP
ncbi:MAG: hypothetical protein ACREEN_00415 [Stellaceae bacterium]